MVRFRIHYEIYGQEDSFILEAETAEDIRAGIGAVLNQRGLDPEINNCWSEKLND